MSCALERFMIGDKRRFNSCLVTLKTQEEGGTQLHKDAMLLAGVETVSAAKENAEYLALIEKAIDLTNRDAKVCPSNAAKVQKFVILPCDFTVEAMELTPTLKVRRNIIQSKYAADIDQLYNEAGKPVTIGRKLDAPTTGVEQPLGNVLASTGAKVAAAEKVTTTSCSSFQEGDSNKSLCKGCGLTQEAHAPDVPGAIGQEDAEGPTNI